MGKGGDAPQGPKWKKIIKELRPFIEQNQEIFKEALSFGKDQFTKGQEFVDRLTQYGMDSSGRLGAEANNFKAMAEGYIKELQASGKEFSTANMEQFLRNKGSSDEILGSIMPSIKEQAGLSQTLMDRYKEQGIPFQDEYIAKLQGWDTGERREARAASAVGDIAMATEAAREAEIRRLEGYGIDPSQTRSAALDSRIQTQNAVAKAAAANQARLAVEHEGLALGKEAVGMYNQSLADASNLSKSATAQGAVAQEIGAQPGATYLQGLSSLNQYLANVSQLGLSAGQTAFGMKQAAEGVGAAGLAAGAGQQNTASNYGSGVFGQAGQLTSSGAGILNSGYNTASDIYGNQLKAHEINAQNSFSAGLGQMIGTVAPAALGSPWFGGLFDLAEGGEVTDAMSPSGGVIPDDVPANLDAGEFVVDADTVRWHGVKNLKKLKEDAQKGIAEMQGIPDQQPLRNPRSNRAPALPPGGRAAGGVSMTR